MRRHLASPFPISTRNIVLNLAKSFRAFYDVRFFILKSLKCTHFLTLPNFVANNCCLNASYKLTIKLDYAASGLVWFAYSYTSVFFCYHCIVFVVNFKKLH